MQGVCAYCAPSKRHGGCNIGSIDRNERARATQDSFRSGVPLMHVTSRSLSFFLHSVLLLLLLALLPPVSAQTFTFPNTLNLISNGSFEFLNTSRAVALGWCQKPIGAVCDDRISVDMIPWHVDPVPVDIQNISCSTGLLCLDLNSDDNSLPGGITYPLALTAGRT